MAAKKWKLFRLNKIGKNPHLVSERETLESDCQQMNDIVAALSAADNDSLDSLPSRCIGGIQHFNETDELGEVD